MFELRVITSLARINWLVSNFGARNDLISVFHQTLTLAKGQAAPDYHEIRLVKLSCFFSFFKGLGGFDYSFHALAKIAVIF